MNWGKGIIIGMSAFVVFISVLIAIIMSKSVDLETEDYYQKEINFNNEFAAQTAWNELQKEIDFSSDEAYWIVKLPKIEGVEKAEIEFKRPNDDKQDKHFEIGQTQTYLISKKNLEKGWYDYKVHISTKDKELQTSGKYCFK